MGFGRFFTMKTDHQLQMEAYGQRQIERKLETPRGLTATIDAKQKEVDDLRAKSTDFLNSIEAHFGFRQTAKYLGPNYMSRSKLEDVENESKRRFAIRWRHVDYGPKGSTEAKAYEVTFVYTAIPTGVRIDYIATSSGGATREVINDNYNPSFDDIYKELNAFDDSFRSVRRYDSHEAFATDQSAPPLWFRDFLDRYIPAIDP